MSSYYALGSLLTYASFTSSYWPACRVWLAGERALRPAKMSLDCSALEECDAGMPLGRHGMYMPTKQSILLQILVELASPKMHITSRCSLG